MCVGGVYVGVWVCVGACVYFLPILRIIVGNGKGK